MRPAGAKSTGLRRIASAITAAIGIPATAFVWASGNDAEWSTGNSITWS